MRKGVGMRWIGRPLNIQDRVPLNISARMDASRVLSLRIKRIGGGRYLWVWKWLISGVKRKKRVYLHTITPPENWGPFTIKIISPSSLWFYSSGYIVLRRRWLLMMRIDATQRRLVFTTIPFRKRPHQRPRWSSNKSLLSIPIFSRVYYHIPFFFYLSWNCVVKEQVLPIRRNRIG